HARGHGHRDGAAHRAAGAAVRVGDLASARAARRRRGYSFVSRTESRNRSAISGDVRAMSRYSRPRVRYASVQIGTLAPLMSASKAAFRPESPSRSTFTIARSTVA